MNTISNASIDEYWFRHQLIKSCIKCESKTRRNHSNTPHYKVRERAGFCWRLVASTLLIMIVWCALLREIHPNPMSISLSAPSAQTLANLPSLHVCTLCTRLNLFKFRCLLGAGSQRFPVVSKSFQFGIFASIVFWSLKMRSQRKHLFLNHFTFSEAA